MPGQQPEEEVWQTDADQHQAAGEIDNEGDQLMPSEAENLTWNSTLPNSRIIQNPNWGQWRSSREAEN